ncbi:MAG: hypothetical protein AAFP17_00870 [Pseudomonadota bacterium]
MRHLGFAVLCGLLATDPTAVPATPMAITDRATFLATGATLTTESLDASNITGDRQAEPQAGLTITSNPANGLFTVETDPARIVEGTGALNVGNLVIGTTVDFTFDTPISAFGVTLRLEDSFGGVSVVVDNSLAVATGTFLPTDAESTDGLFIGIIDTMAPFTAIRIGAGDDLINATFDRLEFGTLPEPSAEVPLPPAALLLIGALGLLLRRRAA